MNAALAKSNNTDNRPVLTLVYHSSHISVRNFPFRNFSIFLTGPSLRPLFSKPPLDAFKRGTTLDGSLRPAPLKQVRSRPSPSPGSTRWVFPAI